MEAAQREADDGRGRRPGWERNPKGGQPYKRACGEPDEKAQSHFTDPDSAIMKTSAEGFQQCYNAQVAVRGAQRLEDLPPNGSIGGEVLGFRRFSVRGLAKARGEWDLVCLALNLKRLQPLLAV